MTNQLIEEKIKEFENRFEAIMTYWGSAGIIKDIAQYFKTSLNEVVEARDKEIEELKRYVRKGEPICNWCGKPATKQTFKGESNLKSGGLSVNDGWYCDECYKKGLEIEEEAMYGS